MDPSDRPLSHEERNRIVLRRTLSVLSWICCSVHALLGLTAWNLHQPLGPWVTGHAALLGLAGFGLWKPRRWGWPAALLASAASVAFVVMDRQWQAAAFDGIYPLLALGILGVTVTRR